MDGLTEGRIVHYVLEDGPSKGEHRAAVIVKVWRTLAPVDPSLSPHAEQEHKQVPPENGCCNLFVLTDGANDKLGGVYWRTSAIYSDAHEPGTWHWIEKA